MKRANCNHVPSVLQSGTITVLILFVSLASLPAAAPDYINVKDYGALGNGTANDTTAIQNAFNAADAAKVSGGLGPPVYFPPGNYLISSTIVWKAHSIIGAKNRAVNFQWGGSGSVNAITSSDLIMKKLVDINFGSDGDLRPLNWIEVTGNTDKGGQIRRCSFSWTSGSGSAPIKLGNVIHAHFQDLRFDRGRPYQIEIRQSGAGGTFSLDGFTIDNAGSDAKGLLNYHAMNSSAYLNIKIANARLESNAAMAAPNTVVNVAGSYGATPAYISLENLDIQISGTSLVNQAGAPGDVNAVSQVVARNIKAFGSSNPPLLKGVWGPELGGIPPTPSEGRTMFMAVGRAAPDAATHNMVQFQSLAIGTGGAVVTGQLSATTEWDPPSVSNGSQVSKTFALDGASVGDTIITGFSKGVPGGALLLGSVTAPGTVTVTLFNKTGSALNLSPGTVQAAVWKH